MLQQQRAGVAGRGGGGATLPARHGPFAVEANPHAGTWGNPAFGTGAVAPLRNPFILTIPPPTRQTPEEAAEQQRREEQTRTIHLATHSACYILQNLALVTQTYHAIRAFK